MRTWHSTLENLYQEWHSLMDDPSVNTYEWQTAKATLLGRLEALVLVDKDGTKRSDWQAFSKQVEKMKAEMQEFEPKSLDAFMGDSFDLKKDFVDPMNGILDNLARVHFLDTLINVKKAAGLKEALAEIKQADATIQQAAKPKQAATPKQTTEPRKRVRFCRPTRRMQHAFA